MNPLFLIFFSLLALISCRAPEQNVVREEAPFSRLPAGVQNWWNLPLARHLEVRGFQLGAPVFVRIFKEERVLELWLKKDDDRYHLYQKYPICAFSGQLGPKVRRGDKQAPEGIYYVGLSQLNPNSRFHLAFNLGFPNLYDRAHGYTGDYLMVHGNCVSNGCYAMGDEQIEEIYQIIEAALWHGQPSVPVHIFPFPLTPANLAKYQYHRWYDFWQMLKPAYDYFEHYATPPVVQVNAGRYELNHILSVY